MLSAASVRTYPPIAALTSRNYRTYLVGQSLANTGSWIQSIAQDWLVLRLTGSAAAVSVTLVCQFLPMLVLGLRGGALADRLPKRRVLLGTQAANAVLTTTLAVLVLRGGIHVSEVWALALLGGLVFALDAPTRQAFVSEVVSADRLRAAVSLNAAVFHCTRLVGPAIAALLIETVGIGWAFAANALCYVGPTIGLLMLRGLTPAPSPDREKGAVREALRYVSARPHVAWTIALAGVVGTLGLNFPIVLTAMARQTFHSGAGLYGAFNVALAVGSVVGALAAAAGTRGRLRIIIVSAALFGFAEACAALAPSLVAMFGLLAVVGFTNLAFQSVANASVQLWVDPALRGRVMGLYMLVFAGGTPIGAPIIGVITDEWGPRTGMLVCGLAPLAVALVAATVHAREHRAVALAG